MDLMRGQVELIDFLSLIVISIFWSTIKIGTKFLYLRPLKSKHAANVADDYQKFSLAPGGALRILQSDNGFVAAIVHELFSLLPHCQIVYGCPQHPQS